MDPSPAAGFFDFSGFAAIHWRLVERDFRRSIAQPPSINFRLTFAFDLILGPWGASLRKGLTLALGLGAFLVVLGCSNPSQAVSDADIRRIADEAVASDAALVPTVTPQPTATPITIPFTPTPISLPPFPTPLPTPTPITFPPTATPQPTATPIVFPPTATPLPTPTRTPTPPPALITVGQQVSGSTVSQVDGDITLEVNPENPLAGRDISFSLKGLKPWQIVAVEFIGPLGMAVDWISERELNFTNADGSPYTENTLYADGTGAIDWNRIATNDIEGEWSMRLGINGRTTTVSYSISQLQLAVGLETVGVELRSYQGVATNTFYSALVPSTLAVDLQGHLTWVMDQLDQRLNLQSDQIPDIYLLGNRNIFEQVGRAIGAQVGAEPGFFRTGGTHPGIYIRTDFLRASIQRTLNHEYVHLILREEAPNRAIPAWLNEGTAEYYEHELALEGLRPDATKLLLYDAIDSVVEAANSGTLMPLTILENQGDWNARAGTPQGSLQYPQAHMVVRYLTETYGAETPVKLIQDVGRGASLAGAIATNLGIQYQEMEQQFAQWLKTWDDPRRTEVRVYGALITDILDTWQGIAHRRAGEVGRQISLGLRVPAQREFVDESRALLNQLLNVDPPASQQALHQTVRGWLEAVDTWLSLELEYFETSSGSVLGEANDMIPEINTRHALVSQDLNTLKFVYNLD